MGPLTNYCGKCGAILAQHLRFCDQCGAPLTTSATRLYSIHFGPVVVRGETIPHRIEGVLEEYVFLRILGEGGMGRVMHAMHRFSGQHFALKVIHPQLRLRKGISRRFIEEAKMQSRIVHPNIVRVFRFLDVDGTMGLVMEFVDGVTLEALLAAQPNGLEVNQVIWLMCQMAAGLGEVHRHGFVHADVKPANFFYGRGSHGRPVLKTGDFGIAQNLQAELRRTGGRRRAGTPGYMSPDQIRGDRLTPASDLYSLGTVVYEMLTGRPVFPLEDEMLDERHLHAEPTPVGATHPHVPRVFRDLVQAMLAKTPDRRPQTANHVLEVAHRLTSGAF